MDQHRITLGCCTPAGSHTDEYAFIIRRYKSKEEQLDQLNSYKDELEKELAGVMERIKELS